MPDHKWMHYSEDLDVELQQAADEGKDAASLAGRVAQIKAAADRLEQDALAAVLLDDVQRMSSGGTQQKEPDVLSAILALRPGAPVLPAAPGGDVLFDRVLGAWQGRCAGCLLGKPVEGWKRALIAGFLRDTGNYPPRAYMSSDVPAPIRRQYELDGRNARESFINRVDGMPTDDDTNYTLLGLMMMEKYGYQLTTADVGDAWLAHLPLLAACTAERVAYKNLAMGVTPPHTGRFRNPYREWIGAQIRADIYGYVCPGDPQRAAALAHADALLSHTRNGIYGAMFVAAMIAAGFCTDDPALVVQCGLAQIPEGCRLSAAVHQALRWHQEGVAWQEAVERLHGVWNEGNPHHWCHTISNAQIVVLALLYGQGDLERAIGTALLFGLDTDCNCATVGSIVGAMRGAARLPDSWIGPLRDTLHTSLAGEPTNSIAALAARTAAVIGRT